MTGYSYQGQDLFVLEVLGAMRRGFFLDSGASNGVAGSNSLLFETELDWSGICVEPNTAMYSELIQNRRSICMHCCLYDRDGSVDFLEAAGVCGGILAEYDPDHLRLTRRALAGQSLDGGCPPAVPKRSRTVRSVLREAGAPRVIDYWSLDTEGSELAILRSFPFDEYRVRVLTVEHNHGPARDRIRWFLEGRGYVLVRELGIDDGYVWRGERDWSWRSRAWSGTRNVSR